ncbi:MAG: hypothetical protein L0Z62_37185 [Gemmataceae bacterium]|nr:hypothetical protein [Gemmataceae bacterium]
MRPAIFITSGIVFFFLLGALLFHEATRPFADLYGNHASVLGLGVSVIGFALTVWTVLETLRVTTDARKAIKQEAARARAETRSLLANIRLKSLGDTCDQALFVAAEAENAISNATWPRAAERCEDIRRLTLRLLTFPELTQEEQAVFRTGVEDLKTVVSFIKRNRLRQGAPTTLPEEKAAPLTSLRDELDTLRTRLHHQLFEVPDVEERTD